MELCTLLRCNNGVKVNPVQNMELVTAMLNAQKALSGYKEMLTLVVLGLAALNWISGKQTH